MSERPSLFDTLVELTVYAPVGLAVTAAEELPDLIAKGRSRIEPQLGTARLVGKLVVAEGRRRAYKFTGFAGSGEGPTDSSAGTATPSGPSAPSAGAAPGEAPTRPGGEAPGRTAGTGPEEAPRPAGTGPGEAPRRASTASEEAPRRAGTASKATRSRTSAHASRTSRPAKQTAGAARTTPSGDAPDVASLAIPGYDSLSASQVVQRLAGLSPSELSAVGRYEAATRGRRTILNRVSQLQGD